MKTWEMIKELTENPGKEFKLKGENNIIYTSDLHSEGKIELDQVDFITIYDEWEEVKKPVDFIELLSTVETNGDFANVNFYYEDEDFQKCNLYYILRELAEKCTDDSELARYILDGKWYIE